MDGYLDPLLRRLKALELVVFGPASDDSGHDQPAQTLAPSRMPAQPGLPIANYDPSVHQDDATDAAIAAENEAKTTRTSFIPDNTAEQPDGTLDDPTLNADGSTRSRRRKADTVEGDAA